MTSSMSTLQYKKARDRLHEHHKSTKETTKMLKLIIAVLIGCVTTTCATDARGPNYSGSTRTQNGMAPYGSYQMGFNSEMSGNLKSSNSYPNYQPQNQMSGAMSQGSNRGANLFPGQQQPMNPNPMMNRNQGMGGEQMMGGQPMENYQGNEPMMGNMQTNYQGNQGMGGEQMMGNPQMGYQPEQMGPTNQMGAMNPNNYGAQGPMAQPGMAPQQGMGMNQGFQPQGQGNFGQPQNPQMFNDEMGVPEERMGATGMEPATFGANAAF